MADSQKGRHHGFLPASALLLALGLSSPALALEQEQQAVTERLNASTEIIPYDPGSQRTLDTLTRRADMYELKSELGALCATGLRLAQKTIDATTPLLDDGEVNEWQRQITLLVYRSFSEEQQNEWRSAGKDILGDIEAQIESIRETGNEQQKVEFTNRSLALLMNAQVDALEKVANDLGTKIKMLKATRCLD